MPETEADRRIRLLVAESFRRTYGTPTMTDAEFDTLVQACLDDQKPGDLVQGDAKLRGNSGDADATENHADGGER